MDWDDAGDVEMWGGGLETRCHIHHPDVLPKAHGPEPDHEGQFGSDGPPSGRDEIPKLKMFTTGLSAERSPFIFFVRGGQPRALENRRKKEELQKMQRKFPK
jgi:hypothetical protein